MRSRKTMQRSYTIQSNGDYLRVEETPKRDSVVVSIANKDHLKVATATIRLNKEQWDALTGLGYSDIELNYPEEAKTDLTVCTTMGNAPVKSAT